MDKKSIFIIIIAALLIYSMSKSPHIQSDFIEHQNNNLSYSAKDFSNLCGNGKCELEIGENPWDCPQDCLEGIGQNNFLIVLLLFIIFALIYLSNKKVRRMI